MDETMPDVIEEVKKAEVKTDAQRRELKIVENEIMNLKSEIATTLEKSQELKKSRDKTMDILLSYEFESTHLEQKERRLMETTLSEAKMKSVKEKSILEDIHANIWQARQRFCEQVREFSDRYGLLASPQTEDLPEINDELKLMPKPNDNVELIALELEIASLEAELYELRLGESVWDSQIQEAKKEIEQLTNEPAIGNDFARLQGALEFCQKQIAVIEAQCGTVQQEIDNHDDLLLDMKPFKESAQFQRNNYEYPNNSNTSQTYVYKPRSLASPKKGNTSYRDIRGFGSNAMNIPQYKRSNLNCESDFKDNKTLRDDEDEEKRFQVTSVVSSWQHGVMGSPPRANDAPGTANEANQGAGCVKKRFTPKAPSAVSMRLLTGKKSLVPLDQQVYKIVGHTLKGGQSQLTSANPDSIEQCKVKSNVTTPLKFSSDKPSVGMPLKGILLNKTLMSVKSRSGIPASIGVAVKVEVDMKPADVTQSTRVPYVS